MFNMPIKKKSLNAIHWSSDADSQNDHVVGHSPPQQYPWLVQSATSVTSRLNLPTQEKRKSLLQLPHFHKTLAKVLEVSSGGPENKTQQQQQARMNLELEGFHRPLSKQSALTKQSLKSHCKPKFTISLLIHQNASSLNNSIKAKTELASSHMRQHMSLSTCTAKQIRNGKQMT